MAKANPIHHNVDGAPVELGVRVRILESKDDTFDDKFVGKEGTVEYLEYECGSGQTFPHDPMIGVRFSKKLEEFWIEEILVLEEKRRDRS